MWESGIVSRIRIPLVIVIGFAGGLLFAEPVSGPHRSPIAVAVSPDGRFAASANHTSQSITLIDLKSGRLLTEHRCGSGPLDLVWVDDCTILVSLLHDDALVLMEWDRQGAVGLQATKQSETSPSDSAKRPPLLKTVAVIPVGDEPRGMALASEQRVFVAIAGADEVACVDLSARRVTQRLAVGGIPKTLAVSPDGKWLATCCSVPGELFVHDAHTLQLVSRRTIFDAAFNLGAPVITADSSTVIFPSAVNSTFPVGYDNIERGWVIDNRLTKLPLPDGKYWQQKQLGLDTRGNAVGDLHAVALSSGEEWLAATCGGTHELLILKNQEINWPAADPGDFIPWDLLENKKRFRRVPLGGRPLGLAFVGRETVLVANYLLDAVQIVDLPSGTVTKTIPLGGPAQPSLARKGETIFYDADRSLNRWFSCHTCHTDGHTSGQTFDTLNDGNYDTRKLTPTLRGVAHTSPWTWHGWQDDLQAAMRKSLRDTLHTETEPTSADVEALVAFLKSLSHPVSPRRSPHGELTPSAYRGQALFDGKAGCNACHQGAHFTSRSTYKVGLESNRYFYPEFNPPSLWGLHARRRFLHDGRAESLREVLTRHHRPEKLAGEELSPEELKDLIAYLQSL